MMTILPSLKVMKGRDTDDVLSENTGFDYME
jgi:hypothetical protein